MTEPTRPFAGGDVPAMPPRCKGCGYALEHLAADRCPECGRPFDPGDPASFTRLPGFLWWKYWAPAVGLAVLAGLASFALFLGMGVTGWGFTLATPVMVGALIGYGVRARWLAVVAVSLPVLGAIVVVSVAARVEGAFCGAILGAIAIVPMMFGALAGIILRQSLKQTRFGQRWYLPVITLLALPAVTQLAQRTLTRPPAAESVATSAVLLMSVDAAWHSRLAANPGDVDGPFRLGMVRPAGGGGGTGLGRTFVARLTAGAAAVHITRRVDGRELDWSFVTQAHVEDRAIRLLDGRMTFEPTGPAAARVTVTTRYQPLLTPRWCWRPLERWAGDAAQRRVLAEMTPR